jgi:hypothetical protein
MNVSCVIGWGADAGICPGGPRLEGKAYYYCSVGTFVGSVGKVL